MLLLNPFVQDRPTERQRQLVLKLTVMDTGRLFTDELDHPIEAVAPFEMDFNYADLQYFTDAPFRRGPKDYNDCCGHTCGLSNHQPPIFVELPTRVYQVAMTWSEIKVRICETAINAGMPELAEWIEDYSDEEEYDAFKMAVYRVGKNRCNSTKHDCTDNVNNSTSDQK
jgi:hypothetical protein